MILLALASWVTQSKGKGKPLNQFPEELGVKREKKALPDVATSRSEYNTKIYTRTK